MVNLKPIDARAIEVRGRARRLGVRVEIVRPGREYVTRSKSQRGLIYRISPTSGGWACGCEGFTHTGCCKHLGAVERRAEREGRMFGRIACAAP